MPDIWYHCTRPSTVDAILREGLRPVPEKIGTIDNAVHLSRDQAVWWVGRIQRIARTAVLEVDLEGLDVREGWDEPEDECAVYVTIPPERITFLGIEETDADEDILREAANEGFPPD